MTSIFTQYAIGAVLLLMATSLVLLISQNWRWTLAAFGLQYLGIFWLVAGVWPISLAAVKLIVGIMAGAVLATSQLGNAAAEKGSTALSGRIFRLLTAGLIWIVVFSVSPQVTSWIGIRQELVTGGLLLASMGLLQMGMTGQLLRVGIGLLSFLAGFEVIYAALEVSVMLAGLLAAITLALALVGAYLLAAPEMAGEK